MKQHSAAEGDHRHRNIGHWIINVAHLPCNQGDEQIQKQRWTNYWRAFLQMNHLWSSYFLDQSCQVQCCSTDASQQWAEASSAAVHLCYKEVHFLIFLNRTSAVTAEDDHTLKGQVAPLSVGGLSNHLTAHNCTNSFSIRRFYSSALVSLRDTSAGDRHKLWKTRTTAPRQEPSACVNSV